MENTSDKPRQSSEAYTLVLRYVETRPVDSRPGAPTPQKTAERDDSRQAEMEQIEHEDEDPVGELEQAESENI